MVCASTRPVLNPLRLRTGVHDNQRWTHTDHNHTNRRHCWIVLPRGARRESLSRTAAQSLLCIDRCVRGCTEGLGGRIRRRPTEVVSWGLFQARGARRRGAGERQRWIACPLRKLHMSVANCPCQSRDVPRYVQMYAACSIRVDRWRGVTENNKNK